MAVAPFEAQLALYRKSHEFEQHKPLKGNHFLKRSSGAATVYLYQSSKAVGRCHRKLPSCLQLFFQSLLSQLREGGLQLCLFAPVRTHIARSSQDTGTRCIVMETYQRCCRNGAPCCICLAYSKTKPLLDTLQIDLRLHGPECHSNA